MPAASPRRFQDQRDDVIQIRQGTPQIYHRGRVFKVPIHLVGEHQLILTNYAYTLYSTVDGEQSLNFPLPARLASSARLVPLWQVQRTDQESETGLDAEEDRLRGDPLFRRGTGPNLDRNPACMVSSI